MKQSVLLIAIFLCISSFLCAQEVVTVSSQGEATLGTDATAARDIALANALEGAVRFAASTALQSATLDEVYERFEKKISPHFNDYVKGYQIVSETKNAGKEKIQIKAEIAWTDLKKDLSSSLPADSSTVSHYRYDAWGNLRDPPDCAGNSNQLACQNNLTYTGHLYDQETGLYYYGARTYDAQTGRFTTTDPATNLSKYHDYFPATTGGMVQVGTQMVPSSTMSQPSQQSGGCVVKTEAGFQPCFGGSTVTPDPMVQNYAQQYSAPNGPSWNSSAIPNHPTIDTKWQAQPIYAQVSRGGLYAMDPGVPASWNSYDYALNSPTNYTDPLGLAPLTTGITWLPSIDEQREAILNLRSGIDDYFRAHPNPPSLPDIMTGGPLTSFLIEKAGIDEGDVQALSWMFGVAGTSLGPIEGVQIHGEFEPLAPLGKPSSVTVPENSATGPAISEPSPTVPGTESPLAAPGQNLLPVLHSESVIARQYQQYYNNAWLRVVDDFNAGKITLNSEKNWQVQLGQRVDAIARFRLRQYLNKQGISEGPGADVLVNRWLRNPNGPGYRIPDLKLVQTRRILDGTIGDKQLTDPQAQDFVSFSNGYRVEFVKPTVGPGAKN